MLLPLPRYEPGLFLVRPDRTLYFASVQTMPVARPHFTDILAALDFVTAKNYPARGEVMNLPAAAACLAASLVTNARPAARQIWFGREAWPLTLLLRRMARRAGWPLLFPGAPRVLRP